ncbi:MAG TPA: nucleotide pyrophosphohydrolase [Burkholderiales bacterium]|nr:nucleotide pyrophosphohydrolase [Burkholderiales bacterium]
MDIKALQWELAAFVVDRGLDPLHTPKNLSMALAAEAGTLLALFKWLADDGAPSLAAPAERNEAADALADSVLHAIHLADRLGIDLDDAIRRKLARNAEKYPPLPLEASAPAPAPAAAVPQSRVAVERRAAADRRITPDRRAAPEQRLEPERRAGSDRRAGSERRSSAPRAPAVGEPEAQARVEPPRVPAPPPPPAATEPPPRAARAEAPPEPPPARATRPEPPPPPPPPEPPRAAPARFEPPPEPPPARFEPPPPPPEEVDEPYADLDTEATRRLVEVLSKQVNRARTDDPLARELHDELTTLKRTLYAENPKRAWLAGSLNSIRRILDEACSHSVGAELRAREHLAEVERILDA